MKHVKLDCDNSQCTGANCNACNLFICRVCGCAEGTLPTDCPGYEVADNVQDDIIAGKVDFKGGAWRHVK